MLNEIIKLAQTKVGVSEEPPGSNRGKEVEMFLRSVGLPGGLPWCQSFLYWLFSTAYAQAGLKNPMPKTGGVLDHWNRVRPLKKDLPVIYTPGYVAAHPGCIKPGFLFLLNLGHGAGHNGIVESVNGNKLVTIEGNSNLAGSREGTAVVRQTRRTVQSVNLGFLDYFDAERG